MGDFYHIKPENILECAWVRDDEHCKDFKGMELNYYGGIMHIHFKNNTEWTGPVYFSDDTFPGFWVDEETVTERIDG